MKKIVYFLCGFFLVTSCDLNEELQDSVTKENANSILGPTQALEAAYTQLQSFQQTDFQFMLEEHPSDEMAGPTRGTDWDDNGAWRSLHLHTWTPENVRIIASWDQLYKGLAFAIDAQSYAGITAEQNAQAVFLQALYTFYITDLFGQVSMRTPGEPVGNPPSKQLKRAEAADFAIEILEKVVNNLPTGQAINSYIANKNAGNALLAKLYLNRAVYKATDADGKPQIGPFTFPAADMDKVVSYSDLAMQNRSLQDNYFENFGPSNGEISNELIFTAKNTASLGGEIKRFSLMTLHYNQKPNGWNGFVALTDLYNKFDDQSDKRFSSDVTGLTDLSGIKGGLLVGQQKDMDGVDIKDRQGNPLVFTQNFSLANSTEEKGMRVMKYFPDYSKIDRPSNDFVFLRLADVMLMKAEALSRKGMNGEALTIINAIRAKRGAADRVSVTVNDILDERARELYWEGHRRTDQIRFSKFHLPVQERATTSDAHVLVFPIPLNALAANSNMKQNPGY